MSSRGGPVLKGGKRITGRLGIGESTRVSHMTTRVSSIDYVPCDSHA